MRPADWAVMALALATVVLYGLWRARGKQTTQRYMLANKQMPWYAMALSIMATQASAITFISTTGQSYVDGMRFVQFYFGLPLAMILISAVAVPIYHRTKVYTAYEYLEQRFDARTRALVAGVFLIQRGLGVGVSLAAPAVVMTVILGWPEWVTTTAMGLIIVIYTVKGGITAITWSEFLHMIILTVGLVAALLTAVLLLPAGVHFSDALAIAGAAHKLNPVVWKFDLDDRYNVWSGLIGGMFLSLAYFGCDQSQVQRYLTGRSVTQSRLSLLFNAVAKIPMQFGILFIGAMVFVFFVFEKPPAIFHVRAWEQVRHTGAGRAAEKRFYDAWEARRGSALAPAQAGFGEAQQRLDAARKEAAAVVAQETGVEGADTNYIFLTFVTRYMPVGLVGLLIAAIFAAAMSTISAEINSLATVTVIDIYKRFIHGAGGGPALPAGIAGGNGVLGSVRGGHGAIPEGRRGADRDGEPGRLAVLRRAAGGVRAGVFLQARGRPRGLLGRAGGRGGDLLGAAVHGHRVPVVQRHRRDGGGGDGGGAELRARGSCEDELRAKRHAQVRVRPADCASGAGESARNRYRSSRVGRCARWPARPGEHPR